MTTASGFKPGPGPNPLNPFLGLPPAALQAFSLSHLAAAGGQAFPAHPPHPNALPKDTPQIPSSSVPGLPFPASVMEHLSSTQALLSLAARNSLTSNATQPNLSINKSFTVKPVTKSSSTGKSDTPLDLSGGLEAPSPKRPRRSDSEQPLVVDGDEDSEAVEAKEVNDVTVSKTSEEALRIAKWSVDEVINYVESIDLCREYAQVSCLHN